MDDTKWARLSKAGVFSCPWYGLSHDRYRQPDGDVGDYFYIDIPGSTMIIPLLEDGRMVLTRQFRYLVRRFSLEFPAGGIKPGYDPLFNAQQELREEAGYVADDWSRIGEFAPYNGVSNELCQVYVARALTAVPTEPDPSEEIEVVALAVEAVEAEIKSGAIWDGMTIASFSRFQHWSAKL